MVATHAAGTHAAQGQVRIPEVQQAVVDASATEGDALREETLHGAASCKQVQRQWHGIPRYRCQRLFRLLPWDHRQHRPEDLLLHHRALQRDAGEDRGGDVAFTCIGVAAEEGVPFRQVALYPLKMLVVHHAREVGRVLRVLPEESRDMLGQGGQEGIQHFGMHQGVVRGDAGLPGVEKLAPGDAFGSEVHVGTAVHDGGAFAAEFQGDGHQPWGCHGQHLAPNGRATGEEDVVEAEGFHHRRKHIGSRALHHQHLFRAEGFCDDLLQHGGGVRGLLTGFHHRAVACGDGAHQGRKHQQGRVVPRCDDEHHAQRLRMDDAACGP